jgi:PqqA peptide cyclase
VGFLGQFFSPVKYRPYALLAELTYRCPLHCPYCSNPTLGPVGGELETEEWIRVMREAAELGVLQVGFSGGEPLQRSDLARLIAGARETGLYTNLITSGVGLDGRRAHELQEAGLDSAQLSFQADEPELADAIAGARAHGHKIAAASAIRGQGIALSMNVVLHRANMGRLREMIAWAHALGAERLELANTQYYGWAYRNRAHLMPTREQVAEAERVAVEEKQRLAGQMEIFYVLPDYYEQSPKPCMNGWGQRYLTVNPVGEVLPCPTASSIAGLRFDSVREHSLAWIWEESESFNRFRGTEWMPEPCQSCPKREIDFGGCRCQAALLTGDAAKTDPVCVLSPDHDRVEAVLTAVGERGDDSPRANAGWQGREL